MHLKRMQWFGRAGSTRDSVKAASSSLRANTRNAFKMYLRNSKTGTVHNIILNFIQLHFTLLTLHLTSANEGRAPSNFSHTVIRNHQITAIGIIQ